MTSPSMVHRSGDTLVVRSVVSGNQLYLDGNETETDRYSEDAADEIDFGDLSDTDDNRPLPECKIRRNYSCVSCQYFTQNPRHYLYHLRDVHKEKVKIYECPNCLYASKHFQKLMRHLKMVHGNMDSADLMEASQRPRDGRRKRKRPSDEVPPPEEDEASREEDEEERNTAGEAPEDSTGKSTELKCSLCNFTTRHQGQLTRHEKQEHIKTKFFRCTKCSYVTHIKARFTKHVKYHSMPMIKCDLCDFRTPYKWNLDRHYKNHNGHGAFRCSACNFTADIKQSLTVHEMNHHVPPVGQAAGLGVGRRRNKVGASDTTAAEEAAAAAAAAQARAQAGNITTSSPDKLNYNQVTASEKQESETNRKNSKIKLAIKKVKSNTTQEQNERHNFDTDFIHPDDIIHHSNGNIYIKNKCKLCNFKSAWDSEMAKHERKVHNIVRDNGQAAGGSVAVKKTSRPIPNLIPIQNSVASPAMSASSVLKIPTVQNRTVHGQYLPKADEYTPSTDVISQKDLNEICAKSANSSLRDFASLFGDDVVFDNDKSTTGGVSQDVASSPNASSTPVVLPASTSIVRQPATQTTLFKKKNASFFDKLKEKLMTDAGESCSLTCKWCGHESKCLSESAGHQKTCGKQQTNICSQPTSAGVTSSTRCQHCRQRCKSSIDLHNHLQVCSEANKHTYKQPYEYKCEKPDVTIKLEDAPVSEDSLGPHPMENVVFVWNNIVSHSPEVDEHQDNNSLDLSIRVQSPTESDGSLMECESFTGTTTTPTKMPTHGNDIEMVTEGRRVFKCPHCSFWATTASRFHVHIVGHLNKKPFECSLCAYRSNWRWDITKHIRLKSVRDPAHEEARVLMTDETGRRNYSKYNKYLTQLKSNEPLTDSDRRTKSYESTHDNLPTSGKLKSAMELPKLIRAPTTTDFQTASRNNPLRPPPPLKAANEMYFQSFNEQKKRTSTDSKKTLFKCKKCNFRDASRENILSHVKGHYRQETSTSGNAETDEASCLKGQAPFRCGHCHQVSNWKHVIQRHCRLKHSGDVRVVIGGKNGQLEKIEVEDQTDEPDHVDVIQSGAFKCKQCPFSANVQEEFETHQEMHIPKPDTSMKCYFCSYYVAQKFELFDHLKLHGVSNPEDYVNRAMQGRDLASPTNIDSMSFKRYKCVCCPYVSNSKSQFMYHKQFHKVRGGPFKCEFCSYNVTRRHLLHQHLRVHGVVVPNQKGSFRSGSDRESDAVDSEDFCADEFEEVMSPSDGLNSSDEQILLDVPLVWVSREGKFSKMYKCRYCPHVNLRKVNIQEHEKMHSLRERNPNSPRSSEEHHCTECSYICNNAGVLSSHLKVHQSVYGQIHCLVDTNKTDEEQISELTRLLNVSNSFSSESSIEELKVEDKNDEREKPVFEVYNEEQLERVLFFCQHCPARFLYEKEYHIHNRFHGIRLFYRCEYCTYAARQRPHLLSHNKVHTDEYQEKTRLLQVEYPTSKDHSPPRTAVIIDGPGVDNGPVWVVISSGDKNKSMPDDNESNPDIDIKDTPVKNTNKGFACKKCPARFFKNEMLQYHMTLHGCNNPYQCNFCDYAARTNGNLQKHVKIHEEHEVNLPTKSFSSLGTVPLSGTDLFQQKSEAQKQSNITGNLSTGSLMKGNPNFIYPTYLKNGRMKEKRYKCHKCPSAFEKREQYKVHLSLHGSKQRYKCENCDYSVKYYANYIQHIKKHLVSADALAAKKQTDEDEDEVLLKDENELENVSVQPFSKLAIKTLNSSAKRGPLKLSVADKQTLMILQQRRASNASSTKDVTTEEKKMFWCPHCPYTNYRRDAVDNHVNRHISVSGIRSNYTCEHCDYTVPQSHFLREHVKIHFVAQKNYQPEGYMVYNNLQLTSSKCVEDLEEDDKSGVDDEIVFEDCGGKVEDKLRFQPSLETEEVAMLNNNNDITKIYVNPENGEFIENSASASVKTDTKDRKSP